MVINHLKFILHETMPLLQIRHFVMSSNNEPFFNKNFFCNQTVLCILGHL